MHAANLIYAGPVPVSLATLVYCLFISIHSVSADEFLTTLCFWNGYCHCFPDHIFLSCTDWSRWKGPIGANMGQAAQGCNERCCGRHLHLNLSMQLELNQNIHGHAARAHIPSFSQFMFSHIYPFFSAGSTVSLLCTTLLLSFTKDLVSNSIDQNLANHLLCISCTGLAEPVRLLELHKNLVSFSSCTERALWRPSTP